MHRNLKRYNNAKHVKFVEANRDDLVINSCVHSEELLISIGLYLELVWIINQGGIDVRNCTVDLFHSKWLIKSTISWIYSCVQLVLNLIVIGFKIN